MSDEQKLSVDELLDRANERAIKGENTEAIALLSQALAQDPSNEEATRAMRRLMTAAESESASAESQPETEASAPAADNPQLQDLLRQNQMLMEQLQDSQEELEAEEEYEPEYEPEPEYALPPKPKGPPPLTLASRRRRAAAVFIDGIVLIPVTLLLQGFVTGDLAVQMEYARTMQELTNLSMQATIRQVLVGAVESTIYLTFFFTLWNGQSLGKKALGIRAVRDDGEDFTVGIAFARALIYNFPLSALWAFIDSEKRGLHDLAVKTHVVEEFN